MSSTSPSVKDLDSFIGRSNKEYKAALSELDQTESDLQTQLSQLGQKRNAIRAFMSDEPAKASPSKTSASSTTRSATGKPGKKAASKKAAKPKAPAATKTGSRKTTKDFVLASVQSSPKGVTEILKDIKDNGWTCNTNKGEIGEERNVRSVLTALKSNGQITAKKEEGSKSVKYALAA